MRTWRYNVSNLRKAAHGSYMSALFDINKQLISYPQLHAIYTDSGVPSDLEATRRTAFIWYHLNLFETVFAHYNHYRIVPLDDVETGYWNSWQEFMRSFVLNASEVKAFVRQTRDLPIRRSRLRLARFNIQSMREVLLVELDLGRQRLIFLLREWTENREGCAEIEQSI